MSSYQINDMPSLYDNSLFSSKPSGEIELKKELLIFAIYVEIGNSSAVTTRTILAEMKAQVEKTFQEIESHTNYLIKTFIFPVKEKGTRMECVFSGENTGPLDKNIMEIIKNSIGNNSPGDIKEPKDYRGFTVQEESKKWANGMQESQESQGIIKDISEATADFFPPNRQTYQPLYE